MVPVSFRQTLLCTLAAAIIFVVMPAVADEGDPPAPPTREQLENIQPKGALIKTKAGKEKDDDDSSGMPFDIRNGALKEAALSFGARGGLAWRTYEIREELDWRSAAMDKVFDFSQLLIAAPSGLLIEPPIISEDEKALIIDAGGQEAAVSDRIYNIAVNAKIVSASRLWRNYLERDWGEVTAPPDILLPQTPAEREAWIEGIREGWIEGVEQADEIFAQDLAELTADYQGMVRYRMLLAQGIVSAPYALLTDRGVTGGGSTMRVGDRAVQITGRPQFNPGSYTWQPANR